MIPHVVTLVTDDLNRAAPSAGALGTPRGFCRTGNPVPGTTSPSGSPRGTYKRQPGSDDGDAGSTVPSPTSGGPRNASCTRGSLDDLLANLMSY